MQTRNNVAFLHIMRTGGSWTNTQFATTGYMLIDSWRGGLKRDWSSDEVNHYRLHHRRSQIPVLFHNHVFSWDRLTLKKFQESGWVVFTIVRHIGDQLCSLYYFKIKQGVEEIVPMDEFVSKQLQNIRIMNIDYRHWQIPDYWRDINIIFEYSPNMFPTLKREFGLQPKYEKKLNVTENAGYYHYLRRGVISLETHKLLVRSQHYRRYLEAKASL